MKINKKLIYFFFILVFFIVCQIFHFEEKNDLPNQNALRFASNEIDETLKEDCEEQLNDIDFSGLDKIVSGLDDEQKEYLNTTSFLDFIKKLIYSNNDYSFQDFLAYIFKYLFRNIIKFLPYFIIIFIIAILYGIIESCEFFKQNSTKNIVFLACAGAISIVVIKIILEVLNNTTGTIKTVSNMLEIIFPIILTLIASLGGTSTVSIFQPTLAIFSNVIVKIFVSLLVPIFIFSIVFNIVSSWSDNVKLEKFSKFFVSLFKSIVGIVFTIFISFLAIQGLTSSGIDGVSIKTAKYALKSYIPVLGSYLSDGVGLILLTTNIIKNAIGVGGLLIIGFLIIKPILEIIILTLLFKIVSAVIEPISQKTSKLLFDVSKSFSLINICLIAIGFMAVVSISILLSVSNMF